MTKFYTFSFLVLLSTQALSFEYKESRHPHKIMDFKFHEAKEVSLVHKMEYFEEFTPYVSTFFYKERERLPSSPEGNSFNYKEIEEFSPENAFKF
jgi:hypothetical protein